jgi:hypothetical protein
MSTDQLTRIVTDKNSPEFAEFVESHGLSLFSELYRQEDNTTFRQNGLKLLLKFIDHNGVSKFAENDLKTLYTLIADFMSKPNTSDEQRTGAIRICKLLGSVVEEEDPSLFNYLDVLIPAIVNCTKYTDEDMEHLSEEAEEESLRDKASGCLTGFAWAKQGTEYINAINLILGRFLDSDTWQVREAALHCLYVIVEAEKKQAEPLLERVMGCISDENEFVQAAAVSVLSAYPNVISENAEFVTKLANMFKTSKNPVLLADIASALSNLIELHVEALKPFISDINAKAKQILEENKNLPGMSVGMISACLLSTVEAPSSEEEKRKMAAETFPTFALITSDEWGYSEDLRTALFSMLEPILKLIDEKTFEKEIVQLYKTLVEIVGSMDEESMRNLPLVLSLVSLIVTEFHLTSEQLQSDLVSAMLQDQFLESFKEQIIDCLLAIANGSTSKSLLIDRDGVIRKKVAGFASTNPNDEVLLKHIDKINSK